MSSKVQMLTNFSQTVQGKKQIKVIASTLQKVKLRLKSRSDFSGESTLPIPEVAFLEAASL